MYACTVHRSNYGGKEDNHVHRYILPPTSGASSDGPRLVGPALKYTPSYKHTIFDSVVDPAELVLWSWDHADGAADAYYDSRTTRS